MKSSQVALFIFTGLVLNCLKETHGSPAGIQTFEFIPSGSCISAGYTSGCCVLVPGIEDCRVTTPGLNTFCYCDELCYAHGDCCSDVYQIQCLNSIRTCESNNFNPGCCDSLTHSCYVPEGPCYCDPTCHFLGDCCIDVVTSHCPSSARVSTVRAFNTDQMKMDRRQQRRRFPSEARTSKFHNRGRYRAGAPISRRQGQMSARPRQ